MANCSQGGCRDGIPWPGFLRAVLWPVDAWHTSGQSSRTSKWACFSGRQVYLSPLLAVPWGCCRPRTVFPITVLWDPGTSAVRSTETRRAPLGGSLPIGRFWHLGVWQRRAEDSVRGHHPVLYPIRLLPLWPVLQD